MTTLPRPPKTCAIYLDLEGVLVTHGTLIARKGIQEPHYSGLNPNWKDFVSPVAWGLVVQLALEFDAEIVITSTLRSNDGILSALKSLIHLDLDLEHEDLFAQNWRTGHGDRRSEEIQDHARSSGHETYLVIDDRKVDLPDHQPFVVHPYDGFTYRNFLAAREWLNLQVNWPDAPELTPYLIFM